jgi:transposase
MPRRITIDAHLGLEELESRYRQAKEATERSHYQAIWLLAKGKTTAEVSEVTGYGVSWIYELVRSYNRRGPDSLGDQRRHNQGAKPLLDDVQLSQLWQALQSPPADGGLWTGPKVAQWMSQLLGQPVSPQRGWEYLKGLRLRLRVPRPEHQEADPDEQEAWKKNCSKRRPGFKRSFPTPTSKSGQIRSIVWDSNQYCDGSGLMSGQSRVLKLIGGLSGCGCMDLSNRKRDKLIGGFCPTCGLTCLIRY